jgi:HEAT repeat protein
MSRKSWYDEITIACLKAFGEMKNPAAVSTLKQYSSEKHHQYIRQAAIEAWKNCAPQDKELHQLLIQCAKQSTLRLQQKSIELLGELYVKEGILVLEEIVKLDFDANLTVGAKGALEKILRVQKP